MKHSTVRWKIAGLLFTAVLGTVFHFLYEWSGRNPAVALISPVNESIWEHMKLLYYPMLLFALLEYGFTQPPGPRFCCNKLKGLALALPLIPVLYYTCCGILGHSTGWINITIFFLAAGVGFWYEVRLVQRPRPCPLPAWAAVTLLGLIGLCFVVLTFVPPHLPLFRDPLSGGYGLPVP